MRRLFEVLKPLDENARQLFSLLLMDTLIITMKSCKVLPTQQRTVILQECREMFIELPEESSLFTKLKNKFKGFDKN